MMTAAMMMTGPVNFGPDGPRDILQTHLGLGQYATVGYGNTSTEKYIVIKAFS
jgi:hypothetical protein